VWLEERQLLYPLLTERLSGSAVDKLIGYVGARGVFTKQT
jgi:hypothetical protein